jgi:hypothetical protein
MIKELESAIKELESLPEDTQRELSKNLLDEIRWQVKFQNSESELSLLANEALEEYKKGETKPL